MNLRMMVRVGTAIAAFLMFVIGLAVAGRAWAGDEVLITSNRDGNPEIYLVELGAKTAKNLTNNQAYDVYPSWSPDGKQIVFSSTRGGGGLNVFVMDADGGNVKQMTEHKGKSAYCAEWAPDGKQIIFNLRDQNNLAAVLLDPQNKKTKILALNVWDPAWSPDGKKIAFTKFTDEGYKIHVMDADGSNEKDIGTDPNPMGWSYPNWSPDGKKLVYANHTGNSIELFVCDADGKNTSQVTNLGALNSYASWTPDGKKILFRQTSRPSDRDTVWPYYLVDPETLNLQVVEELKDEPPLANDENPGRPAFRPKKREAEAK